MNYLDSFAALLHGVWQMSGKDAARRMFVELCCVNRLSRGQARVLAQALRDRLTRAAA